MLAAPSPYSLLSSLSLLPPNRPLKPLHTALLASPSFAARLSVLAQLGPGPLDELPLGASHTAVVDVWGHTGCVNALSWEDGGEGRLASAGDDTKICIWTPGRSSSRPSSTKPTLSYDLSASIATGHRANIFSVKFAPFIPSRLISAAGDSQVRVFDISRSEAGSSVSQGPRTWNHFDTTSSCIRVLRCHTDRVKRLATENSPDCFLSCSEDGTVRQHDLREAHNCDGHDGCSPPLLAYSGMKLYSLSLSKVRPHLFVVAGTSPYAFLHDRRMVREPMLRDWNVEMTEGKLTQCVRRFGVPKDDGTMIGNQIVASKLSDSNGRDLLVSYSGESVYLFDTDADPYVSPVRVGIPKRSSEAEDGADETGSGKGAKRSRSRGKSVGEQEREDGPLVDPTPAVEAEASPSLDRETPLGGEGEGAGGAEADVAGEGAPISSRVHISVEMEADDSDDDESEDEPPPRRRREPLTFEPTVPLVGPRKRYRGHANEDTIKDVNFALADSHVVSGSDDGNFFVWDKESEELVGIYHGDESVVNVIESHPRLPILAVSGIDPSVKLFGPISEVADKSNLIANAEKIIQHNEDRRLQSRVASGAGRALLQALTRQLTVESRRGFQIMVNGQLMTADAGGEEGDCIVM